MQKENYTRIKNDKSLLDEKRSYFLGRVLLHDISKNMKIASQKIYIARFKNSAKTKVHYHEGGQILITTEGKGALVLFKRIKKQKRKIKIKKVSRTILKKGDIVYIPKKTLHWHGAMPKTNFSHIAFNLFSNNCKEAKTIWFDSDFKSYVEKID